MAKDKDKAVEEPVKQPLRTRFRVVSVANEQHEERTQEVVRFMAVGERYDKDQKRLPAEFLPGSGQWTLRLKDDADKGVFVLGKEYDVTLTPVK